MKITFVNYSAGICGGNRVLFEVANGLVNKGHDVEFHSLQSQDWFPLKAPLKVYPNAQQMPEAIPESDVVVATWCLTAYIVDAVKGRKGIPAYYCQHYEPIFFFKPEDKETVAKTYDLPLNLIANSPWLQQMIKQKHNRDSTLIVPGVDHKVFQPQKVERDPKKLKVLAFASATPFKGFYDTVLPAFQFVSRRVKDVELHLYGADLPIPYEFKVTKYPRLTDIQLATLYSGCDLCVSGSWAESSPLPPLEAMACGCPVVCTQPGTEHYGTGIERVLPRAPRTLGAKIVTLLQDPETRASMTAQSLKDVQAFSWENTINGAEQFFKNLIGE